MVIVKPKKAYGNCRKKEWYRGLYVRLFIKGDDFFIFAEETRQKLTNNLLRR